MSVLCTIKYIIASTHIFCFLHTGFEKKNRAFVFFRLSSSFFFFQLWNTVLPALFSVLGKNVLSLLGLQGWNKRDGKLLAFDWAIWWGRSINCSRMDSDYLGRFSVSPSGLTSVYTISLTACRIQCSEIDRQISFAVSLI